MLVPRGNEVVRFILRRVNHRLYLRRGRFGETIAIRGKCTASCEIWARPAWYFASRESSTTRAGEEVERKGGGGACKNSGSSDGKCADFSIYNFRSTESFNSAISGAETSYKYIHFLWGLFLIIPRFC